MGGFLGAAGVMVAAAATALIGWHPAGATAEGETQPVQVSGTWGACGSWWTETRTRTESGSVCGVDGLVTQNGQVTQLAEPLISVSRYVCIKRTHDCKDDSWTGTVRRSEMSVDPLLRRASIRGTLGGCTLDVEFAGLGPVRPEGGVWANHGTNGTRPTIWVGGSQTLKSEASWWGGVCGQTVVSDQPGGAWMFRGAEVALGGFGEDGVH